MQDNRTMRRYRVLFRDVDGNVCTLEGVEAATAHEAERRVRARTDFGYLLAVRAERRAA